MPNQTILLVGHGSRVPEAVARFHEAVDALAEHLGRPVNRCLLELAEPDMTTGFSETAQAAGDGGKVIVLPLFLGAANHQKNDVAVAVQGAGAQFPEVAFRYGTPLGSHAKLVELLDLRVRQALEVDEEAFASEETMVREQRSRQQQ